ncbi:hypothetical protein [Paenibacillus aquistagni]|nr:hypothetical protein [Paenibacillus aquistagni]
MYVSEAGLLNAVRAVWQESGLANVQGGLSVLRTGSLFLLNT